jgi:hypothetical protein
MFSKFLSFRRIIIKLDVRRERDKIKSTRINQFKEKFDTKDGLLTSSRKILNVGSLITSLKLFQKDTSIGFKE